MTQLVSWGKSERRLSRTAGAAKGQGFKLNNRDERCVRGFQLKARSTRIFHGNILCLRDEHQGDSSTG